MPLVGGLDLAGSPRRPSGYVVVDSERRRVVKACLLYTDEDIVRTILSDGVVVLAVDAPLSMPPRPGFREVDRELVRRGFKVLPPTWPGMRALTTRALKLKERLEAHGVAVVETHPTSAWRSSLCSSPLEAVHRLVDCSSLEGLKVSKDVVDAAVAAVVALAVIEGFSLVVRASDGEVYLLPELCSNEYNSRRGGVLEEVV